MTAPPVGQLIRLQVAPEFRDELLRRLSANVAASRMEPGCLAFQMAVQADDPGIIHLWEAFRDQPALEAHWTSPHFLAWKAWYDALPPGAVERTKLMLAPMAT